VKIDLGVVQQNLVLGGGQRACVRCVSRWIVQGGHTKGEIDEELPALLHKVRAAACPVGGGSKGEQKMG